MESATGTLNPNPADLSAQWMQFTANRKFLADPVVITRAEGIHYVDHRGRRILDATSGLYCSPLGHGRRDIAEAAHKQLLNCDFAPSFSMASDRSFELATRLKNFLPEGFEKVFFTNSGSEAVETAMKLTATYHRISGQSGRVRYVSRERAYHGVNLGGLSLNGMPRNRNSFENIVSPNVSFMRHTWSPEATFTVGQPTAGAELAEDLARAADLHGPDSIAACFVEPVVGSFGVLIPPVGYLQRLREICDETGILLVFDEVITGFYRTGLPFASETFGVTPDIITMAKALSNGTQPIGAVAVADHVWERFAKMTSDAAVEFVHGYTMGGHPVACAAALAALDAYESSETKENVSSLAAYFEPAVHALKSAPRVVDIRCVGLMAGIEFQPDGPPGSGIAIQQKLLDRGLYAKCSGDVVTLAPPFVASVEDIDTMLSTVEDALAAM